MKKIGLIGGISWESSAVYYEILNKKVKEELGGFHSARCVLESVNFSQIVKYQKSGDWEELDKIMSTCAKNLENAGADMILVCANTMHICSDAIKKNISIPFIHIADATGEQIKSKGIDKVILLGTEYTMQGDFYKKILKDKYGIDTIIPDEKDILIVNRIIFEELVQGVIRRESREKYKKNN